MQLLIPRSLNSREIIDIYKAEQSTTYNYINNCLWNLRVNQFSKGNALSI